MVILASLDSIDQISQLLESACGDDLYGYIDLQTGEVIIGSQDDPADLELDEEEDDGFEERYLSIPSNGSNDSYRDMVDFIETVTDARLKSQLERAIDQRRPFARFKDVIKGSEELERWYGFRDERQYERAIEWLKRNNINLPSEA
jgi:hypothetical protein